MNALEPINALQDKGMIGAVMRVHRRPHIESAVDMFGKSQLLRPKKPQGGIARLLRAAVAVFPVPPILVACQTFSSRQSIVTDCF